MIVELPFTVVILTLTGIASHDLYQSKLWQDGADNGFNSAPDEVLYAMANYRPFKVPMVWNTLYVKTSPKECFIAANSLQYYQL